MKYLIIMFLIIFLQSAIAETNHHSHDHHGNNDVKLSLNKGNKWPTVLLIKTKYILLPSSITVCINYQMYSLLNISKISVNGYLDATYIWNDTILIKIGIAHKQKTFLISHWSDKFKNNSPVNVTSTKELLPNLWVYKNFSPLDNKTLHFFSEDIVSPIIQFSQSLNQLIPPIYITARIWE